MGLNNWWNDSADKANDFLNTGAYNDVVRNAPLNNDRTFSNSGPVTTGGCTSSSQCPAGYSCVNGVCTLMGSGPTGGSSGGQWNSAGDCDQDDPNSPCNSGGPNSCSQTPNCGDTPNPRPEDCCGDRCCSFGSASSTRPGVNCYCGKCPPWPTEKKCNIFCTAYLASNGESAMGCNEENSCNECNECDFLSRTCEPNDDAPCWCEGSECSDCRKCDINTDSETFGDCVAAAPGTCSVCTYVDLYECPCGETVGPITACSKYDSLNASRYGKNVILTNQTALEIAQGQCAPASSCDPCKGDCVTRTYCSDTTGPAPACPPGFKCTNSGAIFANGVDCTFRTECDMSDVPEKCKGVDCNCHNDCPDCQLCGTDGECYPDPDCNDDYYYIIITFSYVEERYGIPGASVDLEDWEGGCIEATGPMVLRWRSIFNGSEEIGVLATDVIRVLQTSVTLGTNPVNGFDSWVLAARFIDTNNEIVDALDYVGTYFTKPTLFTTLEPGSTCVESGSGGDSWCVATPADCSSVPSTFTVTTAQWGGSTSDPNDLGYSFEYEDGNPNGNQSEDYCTGSCQDVAEYGCYPYSGSTSSYPIRSDGLRAPGGQAGALDRFDQPWTFRSQGACLTTTYVPLDDGVYIGFGETALEAQQNAESQMP